MNFPHFDIKQNFNYQKQNKNNCKITEKIKKKNSQLIFSKYR